MEIVQALERTLKVNRIPEKFPPLVSKTADFPRAVCVC